MGTASSNIGTSTAEMGTAISPGGTCLRGQSRLWSWRDRGKEDPPLELAG